MKRLILLITMIPMCFYIRAQKANELDSLINVSLLSYINERSTSIKDYIKNTYILTDNYPRSFSFCQSIQDLKPKFLSLATLPFQKKLQRKEPLKVLFMGLNLSEEKLTITISDGFVTIKRNRNMEIAKSDWGTYVYEYLCEKKEWTLVSQKYSGI